MTLNEKKAEIVKLVTLLVSSLPMRLPSETDIRLALEGYAIALEDCEIVDLRSAVLRCIKGEPEKLKFAPSAPELNQLVRDAKARRENSGRLEPPKPVYSAHERDLPTDDARKRMAAKAAKLMDELSPSISWDEWKRQRKAEGVIR